MQLIAITGGIATGKSSTSNFLIQFIGAPLIDADQISKSAIEKGSKGYTLVLKEFPSIIDPITSDIDRSKLAALVFGEEKGCLERRKKLENIIHPIVRRRMFYLVCKYWFLGYDRCVLDIPLLIESRLYRWMSFNVLVWSSPSIQIERMITRNGYSVLEAKNRIMAQLPLVDKLGHCQVLIRNESSTSDLKAQIRRKIINNQRFKPSFFWHRIVLHALPLSLIGIAIIKYFI